MGAARLAAVGHHSAQEAAVESEPKGGDYAAEEEEQAADPAGGAAGKGGVVGRLAQRVSSWVKRTKGEPPSPPSPPPTPAAAARAKYGAAHTKLEGLKKRREEVTQLLAEGGDGPPSPFLALRGSCFDLHDGSYKYSMCPYDKAQQEYTSLGTWKGVSSQNGHAVFSFEGGQGCWNGPARSLTVDVQCGADNKLLRVEEPNRCTYRAAFASPAACDDAVVDAALQEAEEAARVARELETTHTEL